MIRDVLGLATATAPILVTACSSGGAYATKRDAACASPPGASGISR